MAANKTAQEIAFAASVKDTKRMERAVDVISDAQKNYVKIAKNILKKGDKDCVLIKTDRDYAQNIKVGLTINEDECHAPYLFIQCQDGDDQIDIDHKQAEKLIELLKIFIGK
jgi:hypothetical protein